MGKDDHGKKQIFSSSREAAAAAAAAAKTATKNFGGIWPGGCRIRARDDGTTTEVKQERAVDGSAVTDNARDTYITDEHAVVNDVNFDQVPARALPSKSVPREGPIPDTGPQSVAVAPEPASKSGSDNVPGLPRPAKDNVLRGVPPPMPLFDFSKNKTAPTTSQPSSAASSAGAQDRPEEAQTFHPPRPKTGINAPMIWPPPPHLKYVPSESTPLEAPRSTLVQEMTTHDAQRLSGAEKPMNKVVFDSIEPNPSKSSSASPTKGETVLLDMHPSGEGHVPGTTTLPPYYSTASASDHTLVFESRFESGNLRRAIKVYEREYDLILKPDINTRGYTQWYYFAVGNTRSKQKYKFNIINLYKSDSLYNHGMKPLMYSVREAREKGVGWVHRGEDVCYFKNHIKRKGGYYYTATFTVDFQHDNDTVYFAYCLPYTHTDLQRYLHKLQSDPKRRNRFRRRALCQTLAGNDCDLLTITSFACDPEALRARKGIVVSARVHPGESNSSYMMHGLIDYLTGPSLDAKILRDNFVFKIVPMLNVDGVVVGNYRCSLAGVDLNRQWDNLEPKAAPNNILDEADDSKVHGRSRGNPFL